MVCFAVAILLDAWAAVFAAGQQRLDGSQLSGIADKAAVLGIYNALDGLELRHGLLRGHQPEVLGALVLGEDVPS